ncbi:MAG TPA: EAL domain-containing protein [Xanthobacteraceae bacterium]|nr:EAL domain-containing protein [Xanthobacteraceae bacterium]
MRLSNMKIGTRLALAFAVTLLLTFALAAVSLSGLSGFNQDVNSVARSRMPVLSSLHQLLEITRGQATMERNALAALVSNEPETVKANLQSIGNGHEIASNAVKVIEQLVDTDQGKALWAHVTSGRQAYLSNRAAIIAQITAGDADGARKRLLGEQVPLENQYLGAVQAMIDYVDNQIATERDASSALYATARMLILALAGLALAVGAVCALLVTRSIVRPLREAVDVAEKVAQGNLATGIDADGRDETGQLLRSLGIMTESLSAAQKELTYLALHDNLTKLPNRLLLEDRLDHAIQSANREDNRFALMFMDLDGFKTINDAYGHHIGDLLLVEVAQRIGANVRSQDMIARVGGDEFVLLAGVAEPADAAALADKVLAAIQEPFQVAGRVLRISTSIGIAMYPGDGGHQGDLLTNADAAMYHAKVLGRNVYCFFEASMNANVHEQLQLVQDLRSALERHELILQYQPKFTAPNGPVIGVEALVRWLHPTRGLITPDRFIPLAEKTGLIVPIGEWVLDEACRQISEWHKAGHRDWTMAVNLSALQFSHASLIPTVREALERHALEPHCLTLEVTESTAMRDANASLRILHQLHDMGVRISIDDFGTGYSSLLYLKRLPASELKIDRGFIRDLARDTEDAAIVTAIVALGKTLNFNIVAEGVETAAQQEFLTRLGCDSLQGFLLGHPMSAEHLIEAQSQDNVLNDAT